MPTYQYRCSECSHQFEQFQKFSEDPLTECPVCGKSVRRVIQPVGIVFKGSGWYITDNRKSNAGESRTAATNGDPKPDGPPKSGAESKTEAAPAGDSTAKPEAKPETKPAAAEAKAATPA